MLGSLLAAASAVLLLAGCRQEEVVKPLKSPEEVRKAGKAKQKPKETAPPTDSETRVRRATPKPTATPIPEDVVLMATSMAADNGSSDSEGGWTLWANGKLQKDMVKLPYTAREVCVEVKGQPASNIWPEFNLNMYNQTTKINHFPLGVDNQYATSSTYYFICKPLIPTEQLEAGDYLVTFRFYNNQVPEGSSEDRNIWLRKIVLKP